MADDDVTWDDVAAATERAGRMYRNWIAGLHAAGSRVMPIVDRGAMRATFHGTIGEDGIGLSAMLDEIETQVLAPAMRTPHPCYAGLVNSSPLPAAPIADLIVSMMNNNGGAFHQSPAATTAEEEVVRALCAVLGYPATAAGLLLPGGTFANLQGLMLARTAHFPSWRRRGPGSAVEPRIYASSSAHFSVTRAAHVLGVGEDNVVAVPTRGRGAIAVDALRERIVTDRAAGATPFAVVATIGTTGTGAVDDVAAVAEVCQQHGTWLHVDACYGGAAALLDELRPAFKAIERADSVAVDAHKWFFLPITAGLVLTRHPDVNADAFGIDVSYIPTDAEPEALFRGVPSSRRSTGLTVWAALRAHGLGPIRAAVRRNVEQTRALERRLAETGLRVLPEGRLSIACARVEPPSLSPAELDALQGVVARRVSESGEAWFSTTRHDGQTWLRFNVVNLHTRAEHVERIAAAVVREAERATG